MSVGKHPLLCLVDTGSCKSLLRADRFNEICIRTHRSPLLRPTVGLQGIAGGRLAVLGETEITLDNVSTPLTVTVVSGTRYDLLLGDPSIRMGKGIINYEKGILTWYDTTFPLALGPEDPAAVMLVNAITWGR